MKMIYDLYKGDINSLSMTPFDKMDLLFDNGDRLSVCNGDSIEISLESQGKVRTIFDNDLRMMFSITYLSPDRNMMVMQDGRIVPAIDLFSMAFRDALDKAQEDSKLTSYSGEREERTDREFTEWCLDISDRLNYMKGARIEPSIPEDIIFPPTIDEYKASKKRYEDLAYSLDAWTDRHYRLAESVNVYLKIANSLLTGKRIEISDKNQLVAVAKDEVGTFTLPVNKLSAGEKQILIIFFRMLFHADPGSLVILDEPEISLHVSWQKKLGPILLDLVDLRDLQILVATHSPTVIHDRWDLTMELRSERA